MSDEELPQVDGDDLSGVGDDDLLRHAWPEGVPDADAQLFARLPSERRRKVAARLRALLAIERIRRGDPSARIDSAARAAQAGLTPDGLFALRRKWEAERSLSSLVPYLGRAERQATQRGDDDPVVVAARALILERAGEADSVLASELRIMFGASLPNMIRLVRRLRRDDATDPARISATFGRSLLVDLSAIDAVTSDEASQPIVVALVVERTTGLALGASVEAAGGDTIAAQIAALDAATAWLRSSRLDVSGDDGPSTVELTIGDGPTRQAAFAAADASRVAGFDLRANSVGPRRYGQRLVSLLGKRFGPIWWRPRSTAPGSMPGAGELPKAMDLAAARALVGSAIAVSNAEVLIRLREGGVVEGGGVEEGAMAAALEIVRGVLSG